MATKRLPAVKALAATTSTTSVRKAAAFLTAKRDELRAFTDFEHYAIAITDDPTLLPASHPHLKTKAHLANFSTLRSAILRTLWSNQIFVSAYAVDETLWLILCDPAIADPVRAFFDQLRDSGVHHPGFVVYPIHSFGILGGAALLPFAREKVRLDLTPAPGIAITPPLRDMARVHEYLRDAPSLLGISGTIDYPHDHVRHYRVSRGLDWLERNPVLLARMRFFSPAYLDNQFFLRRTLEFRVALLQMLSALQDSHPNHAASLFSTQRVNNFETLNIRHYLVFQRIPKRRAWDVRCIPTMSSNHLALAEISALSIELDPIWWKKRVRIAHRINRALDDLAARYFNAFPLRNELTKPQKFHDRVVDSLSMFRRSFRASSSETEPCILLAAALESLVTWSYAPGSGARVERRVWKLLKTLPDGRDLTRAVGAIFKARNEGMHNAQQGTQAALAKAQRAYVWSFVKLMETTIDFTPVDPLLGFFQDQAPAAQRCQHCGR